MLVTLPDDEADGEFVMETPLLNAGDWTAKERNNVDNIFFID